MINLEIAPVPQPQEIVPAPQEAAGDLEETRYSLRLKMKELKGGSSKTKGSKTNSSSGNYILDQFPYVNLSDQEIISLFEVSGLCLGSSPTDKLRVVNHLKNLSRSRFSAACADIIPSRPSAPLVDISDVLLSISSEASTNPHD